MRFIYTKTFLIFFSLLLLTTVVTFLQAKGYLDPVKRVVLEIPRPVGYLARSVASPILEFYNKVKTLKQVISENAELTARLREMESYVVDHDSLKKENEILLKELAFLKTNRYTLQSCSVLSFDPEGITNTFVINCGKQVGLKEGMAVIAQERLIGKLLYVGSLTSTGQFITHPSSSVDTKISRSGSLGLLKGSFASGLVFEALSQDSDLKPGDIVTTAGVDGLVPAGLVVGEVKQVISMDNDLFKKTTVLSPLIFRNIEYVFVVK